MSVDPDCAAAAIFGALADPTRRRLLSSLARRPATATGLAHDLPLSRQAVVKHLTALSEAVLLERERSGRDVRYRFTPEPLSEAAAWIVSVTGQWDDRLATLAAALREAGTASDVNARGDPTS